MKIVVNVIGGLGNQMFQYAFAYSLSRKLNRSFELDTSDFETYWHPHKSNSIWAPYQLDIFQIERELTSHNIQLRKINLLNKAIRKLKFIKRKFLKKGYYQESHHNFDKNVFNIQRDVYFVGYWQSERYFKEYREELLKKFTLKAPIHMQTQKYKKMISSRNSASLHIRRGDYVSDVNTNNFHGVCSLEYYQKAVEYIIQVSDKTCFYIFSDDLDWAKKNLGFIENKIFVESDGSMLNYEEMYLMSLCNHNIIANSSFSWWGAWLNQNNKKVVIAPKKWFNDPLCNTTDVIPVNWTQL